MKSKGFTLIELIVVVSIFSFIVFIAADLFVSIVRQQRRILSQQELLNQTSYIVEYIGRALRMAKEDSDGSCLGAVDKNYVLTHSDSGIKFINHSDNDTCQEFFWDSGDGKIKESKNGSQALPLISDRLQVNHFNIKLSGESSSDDFQPRIVISMEVQVKGSGDQPKKQIQTTISQRNLDE